MVVKRLDSQGHNENGISLQRALFYELDPTKSGPSLEKDNVLLELPEYYLERQPRPIILSAPAYNPWLGGTSRLFGILSLPFENVVSYDDALGSVLKLLERQ